MNREILFRAIPVGEKDFVYGSLIINGEYDFSIYDCNTHEFYSGVEVIEETVGQYTGLKDKNGKEIYEGDIVANRKRTWQEEDGEQPTYSNEISTIVYRNHGFWVDKESFGWEGEGLWDWNEIEVIGNIYQHPTLLTPTTPNS